MSTSWFRRAGNAARSFAITGCAWTQRLAPLPRATTGVAMRGSEAPLFDEASPTFQLEVDVVDATNRRTPLFRYIPGLGIESMDEILVSADGDKVAVVYEPATALRDRPGQKLRWTAVFDVRARLTALLR